MEDRANAGTERKDKMRTLCGTILSALALAVPCFGNPIFDGRIDRMEFDANGDIKPVVMTE